MSEYLIPELVDGKLHPSVLPEGGGGGADGASAYEIAVANGFVGSESEWLESLKGEPGDTGQDLTQATPQAINTQTGTSYTLVAADAGKVVVHTNAAASTITVPANTFTPGQRVDVAVRGQGMVTFTPGASMTLRNEAGLSLVSRAQRSIVTIMFWSGTEADLYGALAAA